MEVCRHAAASTVRPACALCTNTQHKPYNPAGQSTRPPCSKKTKTGVSFIYTPRDLTKLLKRKIRKPVSLVVPQFVTLYILNNDVK